jgi:hypothetical protein
VLYQSRRRKTARKCLVDDISLSVLSPRKVNLVPQIFTMRRPSSRSRSVLPLPPPSQCRPAPKHTTRHPPVAIQNGFETRKLTACEAARLGDNNCLDGLRPGQIKHNDRTRKLGGSRNGRDRSVAGIHTPHFLVHPAVQGVKRVPVSQSSPPESQRMMRASRSDCRAWLFPLLAVDSPPVMPLQDPRLGRVGRGQVSLVWCVHEEVV